MKHFILIVIGILFLIVMSIVPVPVHAQDATPNMTVQVALEEAVRNGPGTHFGIVGHLAAGTVMQVSGCNDNCSWLEVAPAIWIAASQVTPVIANSQPNDTIDVPPPAPTTVAALLPMPTSVPAPTIEVGVNQSDFPLVSTQAPQQLQLISAQGPGMLELATPFEIQAAELPAAQPASANIAAVTSMPSPLPASANVAVSHAPETAQAIKAVIAPGTEVEGLKTKATSYNVGELTRNTENYIGHFVAYYGRILHVLEARDISSDQVTYTLGFAVDDENLIVAKLVDEDGQGFRPMVNDLLTIWGIVEGRAKYAYLPSAGVMQPTIRILYLETESEQAGTAETVSADESTTSNGPTLKVLSRATNGSNNYLYIYGEVQNQSDFPVDGAKVEVVLRDANGNVVATDDRFSLLDTIPANGKSPFSIGFPSWKGVTSYNISVEGNRGLPNREDLIIRTHNSNVEGSRLQIGGEVVNTGTTPAQSVNVIITLYDYTGRVVGSDYAYKTLGAIPPGGTVAFSTSTSLPEEYSYYEIQVEGR